jgi:histidinol phosphatase-like PHP family hydrolase
VLSHTSRARQRPRRRKVEMITTNGPANAGVVLEINAQPERLDLDDISARRAIKLGASVAIDTDAHSIAELRFMRWALTRHVAAGSSAATS